MNASNLNKSLLLLLLGMLGLAGLRGGDVGKLAGNFLGCLDVFGIGLRLIL